MVQTKEALRLAEENAAAADSVISQVFTRISEQSPSRKNTALLNALVPYYQSIVRQRNIPESKIREAYGVIGECALRSGDYVMAEKAFRQMVNHSSDPHAVNQLAAALRKQKKKAEADKLSRQVVARYKDSNNERDRFEVVRALLALSSRPDSPERSQAFRILESLLKEKPNHAEYRFLYAVLLGGNPRLFHSLRIPGVEPNAVSLLSSLAEAHPDNPEYGLALINIMLRRFRMRRNLRDARDSLDDALFISERMLGRWPNDPQIVSAAVRLHFSYLGFLRQRGKDRKLREESERMINILEVLSCNPEISDAVKEELIRLQLMQLQRLRRYGSADEIKSLVAKIERELKDYRGAKRAEFRKQLEAAE